MDEENTSGGGGGGVLSFFEQNPTFTIGAAVLIALLVGGLVLRKNTANPAANASQPQDLSGLGTDSAGNHIVYVPTSTQFTTINKNTDSNNNNNNTNPAPTPTPTPTPTPQPTTYTAFVRSRYSTPQVKGYDDTHPNGVPVRSGPGGDQSVIREQAFGSTVTITGNPSTGKTNFLGSLGSTQWLPLAGGGFISAYDITGEQGNIGSGGGYRVDPVSSPAHPRLVWTRFYTIMPGDTKEKIAQSATHAAKNLGAPHSTVVTWQQIVRHNSGGQFTIGSTLLLPEWQIL